MKNAQKSLYRPSSDEDVGMVAAEPPITYVITEDKRRDAVRKKQYRKVFKKHELAGAKCEDCGGPMEILHHRDENHCNNDPRNLKNLCRKCHLDAPHRCDRHPEPIEPFRADPEIILARAKKMAAEIKRLLQGE